jgi:hypothetical protein
LSKLFAPDVVIMAPMLTRPVQGVRDVLNVIDHAVNVVGPIQYTLEVRDPRQTILLWQGHAGGAKLEAATVLLDGDDGLIREVRVVMRPWPVATIFRNAMHKKLASVILPEYWELQPKPANCGAARKLTSISLKAIGFSENVTLHSPMLAKSVRGKSNVVTALTLAHSVQSASSYTSIIATPNVLVELFDCDADGHPMEGLWVSRLNQDGLIDDLTVYLRPYPAVTVLRTMAKLLAERTPEFAYLNEGYWELAASA